MSRPPEPLVSDHAVLRELQRARGIDVEAVRRQIAAKVRRGVAQGACGVLVDGLRYVIRNGTVVTILHSAGPPLAERPAARRARESDDGG